MPLQFNRQMRSLPPNACCNVNGEVYTDGLLQILDGGAIKSARTSDHFRESPARPGEKQYSQFHGGTNGTIPADLEAGLTVSSFTSGNGSFVQANFDAPHSFNENDFVVFSGESYRVASVVSSTGVLINLPYTASIGALTGIPTSGVKGTFAEGEFQIRKFSSENHGTSLEVNLEAGASDYGRNKIHRLQTVRSSNVKTVIRGGHYIPESGIFDVPITYSDDIDAFGVDESVLDNGRGLSAGYAIHTARRYGTITGIYQAP